MWSAYVECNKNEVLSGDNMIDYSFVPETLDWCKQHYVPPIEKNIHCPYFGEFDAMNGGCIWCSEMCPYECEMCRDESWVRGLVSPAARIQAKTRKEAAEFIEYYKQKNYSR